MEKLEDRIQAECVTWFTNTYCLRHQTPRSLILSIPNGGTRDVREAMTLKSTGLLPGASDLIVVHMGVLLWVEVKTDTGRQSKEQIEFQQRVTALGYRYELVRSLDEFKALIGRI